MTNPNDGPNAKSGVKAFAIVQARMGSTRLPGKVMQPIGAHPLIELLLKRLSTASRVDTILVATGDGPENQPLDDHVTSLGFQCFRGDEANVLDRFAKAAINAGARETDVIIRITGDCPLVDPDIVDEMLGVFLESEIDYLGNGSPATFPDGLDVEIFSMGALLQADEQASEPFDREHVTPFLRRETGFRRANHVADQDWSALRWTVDEPADIEVVRKVFGHFSPDVLFSWKDVLQLRAQKPEIFSGNLDIHRNEGANMGKGQKLYKRAKQIIPGGTMLLSKRPEMFLPEQWPSYFSKSKGCQVWDLDGNAYEDFSLMGIGTNTLGYAHEEVDEAVMQTIANGNLTTLNCPEEVYLAEKLIELHPWAGGARFTRAGGEANAVAIRIARAASKRDKVAICGYHGWHDWYLSANLGDAENLAGHLLPGLDPNGVPQDLRGSVLPFNYNDYEALEAMVKAHDVGVIKMEVIRNQEPKDDFLQKVRALADEHEIILIFDECTSGFRQTFGGLYKQYGVEPDMMVLGKTLGNGYAINAVLGRDHVMTAAESSFISSTFWTERIGPTAALKTLEVMERISSWNTITEIGNKARKGWQTLADKHGLQIDHFGLPALAGYSFRSDNSLAYKTLITQEMLKKNYLAGTALYACIAHTDDKLEAYLDALDPIFATIRECEDGRNIMDLLEGPVCHGGFKRLN